MTKWLKRILGAVVMGLAWTAPWALVGVLVGLIVDPDEFIDEMWVAVGGVPRLPLRSGLLRCAWNCNGPSQVRRAVPCASQRLGGGEWSTGGRAPDCCSGLK